MPEPPTEATQWQPVDESWTRALAVVAHPDDLEYGAAAAIARWTSRGKQVAYCLATSGVAGIAGLEPERAGPLREAEQRASAAIVGVDVVEFLGYPDGMLEYGLPLRRDIARMVRRHRPEAVITINYHEAPAPGRRNQADHIALGRAVLDGVRDAANPWVFRELADEGLPAWHAPTVLVSGGPSVTHGVDVTDYLATGIASLEAHGQYLAGLGDHPMANPAEFLEPIARAAGSRLECSYAVGFEVLRL